MEELELGQLDSAAAYPLGALWVTETLLGQMKASEKGFVIDTKILAFPLAGRDPNAKSGTGSLTEETRRRTSMQSFKKTFELLGVEKVNIVYTHYSDPVTPAEESARAFDKHFRAGHFEKVWLIHLFKQAKLMMQCSWVCATTAPTK